MAQIEKPDQNVDIRTVLICCGGTALAADGSVLKVRLDLKDDETVRIDLVDCVCGTYDDGSVKGAEDTLVHSRAVVEVQGQLHLLGTSGV